MPETFLVCESCGSVVTEENSDGTDITREGSNCCGAGTMVYVGAYVGNGYNNSHREKTLIKLLSEWE